MPRPLLYEINTRCWLRELSEQAGFPIRLGNVPEAQFELWRRAGFSHVWLMGVWTTGPKARETFLHHADCISRLNTALPGWSREDVAGSPYAISEYRVPDGLGGDAGLAEFRRRLNVHGMGLVLDFVPNHVGLDHPWVAQHPEWFVQCATGSELGFPSGSTAESRWLAHGKDPFFPPWNDTVQLDCRRADVRRAMTDEMRKVAERCDGLRCDMAMLVLNDVFEQTWRKFPGETSTTCGEFWAEAIGEVRRPGFVLVAEAYWDLEARLQTLGFDFTYDKRVTDFVMERDPAGLQKHLAGKDAEFLRRSVHFLENHDEARAAGRLSLAEHRAAAFLILALPGMGLLHEGQMSGARIQLPVHLGRRCVEPPNPEITAMYEELLAAVNGTWLRYGLGSVLPMDANATTASDGLVAIIWRDEATEFAEFDLALVNFSARTFRGALPLPGPAGEAREWAVCDWLGDRKAVRRVRPGAGRDERWEVPPHGTQLLRFRPVR